MVQRRGRLRAAKWCGWNKKKKKGATPCVDTLGRSCSAQVGYGSAGTALHPFRLCYLGVTQNSNALLLMSYKETQTCAVLLGAPQNVLSRSLSVFSLSLACTTAAGRGSSVKNLLWQRLKNTALQASNTIALGYEASMSFIVFIIGVSKISWYESI